MSHMLFGCAGHPQRFPRVSGDEPVSLEDFQTAIEFSPRERG